MSSEEKSRCRCPFCAEPLTEGSFACGPCGVTIVYCECGKPLPKDADCCPECGQPRPEPEGD